MNGSAGGGSPGYFSAPTLLSDVDPGSKILHTEIFGPVAPISTFGTEQEGIALANDTEYGLVSYLYTQSLARGIRCMESLAATPGLCRISVR